MDNKESPSYVIKYFCADDFSRSNGLMRKPELKADECAFFTFPQSQILSFWNKNVTFDIFVLFCDDNFNIRSIKLLKAGQTDPVESDSACKYVIEISSGFFEKKPEFRKFIKRDNKITLLKYSKSENFENESFQKIANSIYKSIR